MAILKNQEIWFAKLNPARPDKNKLDPTKPNWSVQCRTTSKVQRKEWIDMGIKVKTVREDKSDEESPILYYSVNFRKSATKTDDVTKAVTKSTPPDVVNGKNQEIDATTIGNQSIANLRLYRRDYEVGGIKKVGYTLMGVQIVKHVVYIGAPFEEFEECETETVMPEAKADVADDSDDADLY